jgi:nucleoprotein TPR
MQRTRESAIASAVEKAKGEVNTTTSAAAPNTDEITKKHAHEIEALRAEHEAALKHAVEAAVTAARAGTNASSEDATKAIAAAIANHDQQMQAKHAEEISAAVERGRMEQGAKIKLKDALLVRSQNKVKDLEAQVLEWRKAGLVPDATAAPAPGTVTIPASSAVPPATPTTPVASTSKMPAPAAPAVPAPAASTSAPASTPAAPLVPPGPARRALGGAVPLGRGAPRGRGRGLSIRGAAPSHGTAPSPTAAVAASSASTVGVQIMGAANKRGREDETQPDDSLAKRLKPAGEGAAAAGGAAPTAAGGGKPPVALRRPPPS